MIILQMTLESHLFMLLLKKDIIESENWPELERLAKQHADKLAELKTKLGR